MIIEYDNIVIVIRRLTSRDEGKMKIIKRNISLGQKSKIIILDYLKKEKYKTNDKLPSEPELMRMLGVSRHTIREALALLEQQKFIYKVQGKGTFLKRQPLEIESGLEKLESVTEMIKKENLELKTKWIGIETHRPTKDMIAKLNLQENENVVTFKRLRIANGEIVAYCVDTISEKYYKKAPIDTREESIFKYLKDEFAIVIDSSDTHLSPILASKEMVEKLKVDKNQLFLLLCQIHYDVKGNPIIYGNDYFNSDVIKFKINRKI